MASLTVLGRAAHFLWTHLIRISKWSSWPPQSCHSKALGIGFSVITAQSSLVLPHFVLLNVTEPDCVEIVCVESK